MNYNTNTLAPLKGGTAIMKGPYYAKNGLVKTPNVNRINTYADYGNMVVQSKDLALQRGSGSFNPSPNYEQTTDRGPAYSEALTYYADVATSLNGNDYINNVLKPATREANADPVYANTLDKDKLRPYVVGTTNLHPQKQGSWSNQKIGPTNLSHTMGTDEYQQWACKSLNMVPNALLNFFFSGDNVDYLQETMISEIQRIIGTKISKQSVDTLLIIMRNKYVYAISGWLPHPGGDLNKPYERGTVFADSQEPGFAYSSNNEAGTSLTDQLTRLNKATLEECIKQILAGVADYKMYYRDASSLPLVLDRPVYTSEKGSRVLSENLAFESGHERTNAINSYNQRFNII